MDMKEALDRAEAVAIYSQALLEKAAGRKRIPGDGDGDGIAYEGRGKKSGGAAGSLTGLGMSMEGKKAWATFTNGDGAREVKNKMASAGWTTTEAKYDARTGGSVYQMQHKSGQRATVRTRSYDVKRPKGPAASASQITVELE